MIEQLAYGQCSQGLLSITVLQLVSWYISYVLLVAAPTRSKQTILEWVNITQVATTLTIHCWPFDNWASVEGTWTCSAIPTYSLNNLTIPSQYSACSEATRGSVGGGPGSFQAICELRVDLQSSKVIICTSVILSRVHRVFSPISLVVGRCGRTQSCKVSNMFWRETFVHKTLSGNCPTVVPSQGTGIVRFQAVVNTARRRVRKVRKLVLATDFTRVWQIQVLLPASLVKEVLVHAVSLNLYVITTSLTS